MKDHLLIQWHLGLGDAVICNAIVRHYATQHELVCVPVKYHNCVSVEYMLKDVPNVVIRPVYGDEDMVFFANEVWKGHKLGLGMYGGAFNAERFDREFYRQSGLDFDLRWEGWKCERDPALESMVYSNCYEPDEMVAMLHDDIRFRIDRTKMRPFLIERVTNIGLPMMAWWKMVERANEIHAINSSFALFVDSLKELPNNPPLHLHLYSRPGGEVPTFKKNWIKLT